jgi:hypothetical protein
MVSIITFGSAVVGIVAYVDQRRSGDVADEVLRRLHGDRPFYDTTEQRRDRAGMSIGLGFRHPSRERVQPSLEVGPGDRVHVVLAFTNIGSIQMDDVYVRLLLPPGVGLVPTTTRRYVGDLDGQLADTPRLVQGGYAIGSYLPGATGYLTFNLRIGSSEFTCGSTSLPISAFVRSRQMPAELRTNPVLRATRSC